MTPIGGLGYQPISSRPNVTFSAHTSMSAWTSPASSTPIGARPSRSKPMPNNEHPTIFIIFGIAGDLAWRKLIPALFSLYLNHRLPEQFVLLGIDRVEEQLKSLAEHLETGVGEFCRNQYTQKDWQNFSKLIQYQQADFT